MSQRRTLPPRSTRGKRSQQSHEEQLQQNSLYQKLFEKVEKQQDPNNKLQTNAGNKPNNINKQTVKKNIFDYKQRVTMATNNRCNFPFTRGYHYEFPLDKLQRVKGSPSYAIDSRNILRVSFALEQTKVKQSKIGQLMNRKLIGLPELNTAITGVIRQKNPCSILLFQNQDKKYALDRLLVQLNFINNNLQQLLQSGKIHSFGCLKKDTELILITQMETSLQEKRRVLVKKIRVLQDRKDAMKTFFINQDRLYYDYSLNNELHTKVSTMESLITSQYIIENLNRRQYQREQIGLSYSQNVQQVESNLKYLFVYDNGNQQKCVTPEAIKNFASQIHKSFFMRQETGEFGIQFPVCFLAFPDEKIMKLLESYVIQRLLNQSQAVFYTYKSFWKKVFNRNLEVDKEPKHLSHSDFHKIFMNFVVRITKSNFQKRSIKFPMLDTELSLPSDKEQNHPRCFRRIPNKITIKQYVVIYMFNIVFMGFRTVLPLLENSEILNDFIRMISSDYYGKYHYVVTGLFNCVDFGIIHETMKKALQVLISPIVTEEILLGWVYDEEQRYGYVIKSAQILANSTTIPSISDMNMDEYEKPDKRKNFEVEVEEQDSDKVLKRRKLATPVQE